MLLLIISALLLAFVIGYGISWRNQKHTRERRLQQIQQRLEEIRQEQSHSG